MTSNEGTRAADRGVRLPKDLPSNWAAKEIVYTRYTIDASDPAKKTVIALPGSHVVRGVTIEAFIKSRLDREPLPDSDDVYRQCENDTTAQRPIDIFVSDKCWVVIELDDLWDWQFEPGLPGVTTRDDHKAANGGLKHVMPGGGIADHEGPTHKGCRLVYFGVAAREDIERQRFFCQIDFSKSGVRDDPVDPDIPNDGGKFPYPFIEQPDSDKAGA